MAEVDELFDVRNGTVHCLSHIHRDSCLLLYVRCLTIALPARAVLSALHIGAFQQCINEANKAKVRSNLALSFPSLPRRSQPSLLSSLPKTHPPSIGQR
jgi:hypothetical protein